MKPSLTVGLVPRIATRLIAPQINPVSIIESVSVPAAKEKKASHAKYARKALQYSWSLIQPFSSFLRGAIRFKSPRFQLSK
jgi:hypothetical protein